MKIAKALPITAALVILTGCGSTKVWYQPGKSYEDTRRDWGACSATAATIDNPLGAVNLGFAIANAANKNSFKENCMVAKGYMLVDKNSLPAGVIGVPK